MDGVDFVAKEQKLESVGLLLSDDPSWNLIVIALAAICRCGHGFNDLARIPRSSCFHGSSSKPIISSSLAT